jgi:hypothetical protein
VSGCALLATLVCDREDITMQSDLSKLQGSGDHTVLLRRLAPTVSLPYIPGRVYLSGGAYDLAARYLSSTSREWKNSLLG